LFYCYRYRSADTDRIGEIIVGMRTATACNYNFVIIKLGIIINAGIKKYIICDITFVANFVY
jgi:hypothetical protein